MLSAWINNSSEQKQQTVTTKFDKQAKSRTRPVGNTTIQSGEILPQPLNDDNASFSGSSEDDESYIDDDVNSQPATSSSFVEEYPDPGEQLRRAKAASPCASPSRSPDVFQTLRKSSAGKKACLKVTGPPLQLEDDTYIY